MSLKIGIIGFGGMAHWHATNASKIEGVDFVAHFLETREGYCTYYASAMAVLARCPP